MLGRNWQPNIKMLVCERRCFPSQWRPFDKPLLNQIRLVHFLDCPRFFAYRNCKSVDADRSAVVLFEKTQQDPFVHFIQAVIIHLKCQERVIGAFTGNDTVVVF